MVQNHLAPFGGAPSKAEGLNGRANSDLEGLAKQLLDLQTPLGQLYTASEQLYDHLVHLGNDQSTLEPGETSKDTTLPTGLAISPSGAAMCLRDPSRTRAFGLGLLQAIQQAKAQFTGERIRVLYAGTGPFATLALLCCPFLQPTEVGFTFLDIHHSSLKQVNRIFRAFGFDAFIDEMACADAAQWVHNGPPVHVAVAEVMQRALRKEPQVAVTSQICAALHPQGLLVPEHIGLELSLFDVAAEYNSSVGWTGPGLRKSLGTAFELTRDITSTLVCDDLIPLGTLTAPDGMTFAHLQVLTHITTFNDIVLAENSSGLTTVQSVHLPKDLANQRRLTVSYEIGKRPGLVFADTM